MVFLLIVHVMFKICSDICLRTIALPEVHFQQVDHHDYSIQANVIYGFGVTSKIKFIAEK